MTYFNTREIAAISLCAALWGVLNSIFSPIFFRMFNLPFLCDLIGFSVLTLAAWWIRKFGAITMIGLAATAINFILAPSGIHFLGFTVAAVFFDLISRSIGYNRSFNRSIFTITIMMTISILSAALAGYLIGTFFMPSVALIKFGGVLGWAGLHSVGGIIGGAIGTSLILSLNTRKIIPNSNIRSTQKPNFIRDSE